MIRNIAYFMKKGIGKAPVYLQFVTGVMGDIPATGDNLPYLVNFSKKVLDRNVRAGLEDNLYIAKGQLAKSNAEPIDKMTRIIWEPGREVATPEEARKILGLR